MSQICGKTSGRVHGRYRRTVTDLAIAGQPVTIQLEVRLPEPVTDPTTELTVAAAVDGVYRSLRPLIARWRSVG